LRPQIPLDTDSPCICNLTYCSPVTPTHCI
jgi:hypothetical protein